MKKISVFIFIFLITFELFSLTFTKLGLFIFNETPKYSFEKKFLHDWIKYDEDGIVWHKKNYKTRHISRCFDVEYETNNIGARDYNDYFENDQNKSIMLIGDSFAEGPGVEIDKIFAKLIEKKTGKKVLNFGNSGTEPKSQLIRYKKFGSNFNFDELIYFFLPQNDFLNPIQNSQNKKTEKVKNSQIKLFSQINLGQIKYQIVNILSRFTYSYNFFRSAAYSMDINFNYGYENLSYFYKDIESINYTYSFLEEIIKFKRVKSYIVIIPTIYDINRFQKTQINYKDLYWYKKILKIAENNNTILIDLMDFIDFKEKAFYFHSCDGHWSELGNFFAFETFLSSLNY